MQALAHAGIAADLCIMADNCHVDDSRNAIVRQFMMSKATHLLFIDNDVGFSPDNLVKLASYDRDMVAGVYPLKEESEGYPVRIKDGIELWSDSDGLVEVEGLPTGFLKISRRCIEKMIESFGDRQFYGRGQTDHPHVILFERTFVNGVRYSGDYAFCEKWKSIGGKMYVDPEMHFTHSGTKEWEGCLGDYWRKVYGVNDARFDEAIERMKSGRFDAETAQWLIQGWGNPYAASVNTLVSCWHTAKKAKNVLETGSGLTTIVMALANDKAKITTIESEPIYGAHLSEVLKKHNINNVEITICPLVDKENGKWYDFKQGTEFYTDLVVLDGPNRQKGNRNIAFTELNLDGSTVIIDDAEDSNLLDAFNDWAVKNGRQVVMLGIKQKTAAISLPVNRGVA